MKKFLSLVLALVMTMSLVTISAGAKDFTDADKVNYTEAVDVMSAVKVIDGYTDGSFNPQGTLTRGAAAKIICNLILGPTTAAALKADTAPFKDVPTDHTFAGYIAYCAKEGIISGYADGTFRPAATLTNYAFLKMLLGALGYDAVTEGYVGDNWSINVAKQALAIGLTDGLKDELVGTAPATREQACLYALNTMQATMIEYVQKTTVNVGGAEVVLAGAVRDVEWGTAKLNDGNIKADGFVQFAEKYFPSLELEVGHGIYGRPANTWKLKKAEIGTYTTKTPSFVYTEATDGQDVYKEMGKVLCDKDEYEWEAYINGKEVAAKDVKLPVKNDDDTYAYTGDGAVTEIYVEESYDAKEPGTVTVVEFNYYIGQVTKVKDTDDGETITVKALSKEPKLDDKTFVVDGYEEDDYVVFTVDFNDDEDFVIGEVCEPETVTGEVTRVEKDTDATNGKTTGETYVKLDDGSKHTYSGTDHIVYDLDGTIGAKVHPELTEDYILYLDPNGFVLGFEKAEDTADQYLYVLDSDEELHDWVAKVVLPDATQPKVDLKDTIKNLDKDGDGKDDKIAWIEEGEKANIDEEVWAYTVSDKGVYTLKKVADTIYKSDEKKAEIHNGKAYITEGVDNLIVDKKTVFVDVDGEKTYTGYKEVPNVENATLVAVVKDNVAKIVFILEGDIYDENSTYFMLLKDTRESLKFDGDNYWEYSKAYVNGEKTSLTVAYDADKSAKDTVLTPGVLYKALKSIEDGKYITEVEKVALADLPVNAVGDDAFWLTVNQNKTVKYDCDEETVFVLVEYTDKGKLDTISAGNIGDMFVGKDDDGFQTLVSVVKDANDKNTARLVYITYMKLVEVPAADKAIADAKAVLATVSDYSGAELMTLMTKLGDAKKALMGIDKSKLPAEKLAEVNSTIDALTNATTTAGNDYAKYLAGEQNKKDTAIAKETALKNIAIIEGRLAAVKNVMAPADVELLSTKIALAKKTIEDATTVVEVTAVSIDETALKAAEAKVAEAKADEKAALEAAKDLTGNSEKLQDVVNQIDAAIAKATAAKLDTTALVAAKAKAEAAYDAAKAAEDKAQADKDAAEALKTAKEAAQTALDEITAKMKDAVIKVMNPSDAVALQKAVSEAQAAIDAAKVAADVPVISGIDVTALNEAVAKVEATDKIKAAVTALNAYKNSDNALPVGGLKASYATDIMTVINRLVKDVKLECSSGLESAPAVTVTAPTKEISVTLKVSCAPAKAQNVTIKVSFTDTDNDALKAASAAVKAWAAETVVTVGNKTSGTNLKQVAQAALAAAQEAAGSDVEVTNGTTATTSVFANTDATGKITTANSVKFTLTAPKGASTTVTVNIVCKANKSVVAPVA